MILSGFLRPFVHEDKVLAESLRILTPGGKIVINEPVLKEDGASSDLKTCTQLISKLKINGFVLDPPNCESCPADSNGGKSLAAEYGVDNIQVCKILAKKPQYEAGFHKYLKEIVRFFNTKN